MDHKQHAVTHDTMTASESSLKEYAKFVLIIMAITLASWLLARTYDARGLTSYLRWFMGIFFLVFASFKFIGYKMFALMFASYDILAKRVTAYAYIYPFVELALAVLYLCNVIPMARDVLTIIIMSMGSVGVVREIKKRSGIHCACLGTVVKLPLSTVSLVEDVGMGLMALLMLLHR